MILGERHIVPVHPSGVEPDVSVAVEHQRRLLGVGGCERGRKRPEALKVEVRQLVRQLHRPGQVPAAKPARHFHQHFRLFEEFGLAVFTRRGLGFEIQFLGGRDDGKHGFGSI